MADYPVTPLTPELSEQEIIRRQKLQALIDEGRNPYEITRFDVTHHSREIIDNFEAMEGVEVSLAGRMTSRRVMGKASFAHLLDGQGDIQIYVIRDDLGVDEYAAWADLNRNESLARTGRRVPRVYLENGEVVRVIDALD